MADLSEVGALLHVHKLLLDHGDMFPNLKANIVNRLKAIEEEHGTSFSPLEEPEQEETGG